MPRITLADKVRNVLNEAGHGIGPSNVESFIHILTPEAARRVEPWLQAITDREVRRLVVMYKKGDRDAETVLLLKYIPVAVPYIRQMNSKRSSGTSTVVPHSPIPFSLHELKELGIDQEDVIQEAVTILLELLRSFKPHATEFLGNYLKDYFRMRFVDRTARTLLYRENGEVKSKKKVLRREDLLVTQDVHRSAPITNFAEFLNKASGTAFLLRDLRHYLGDQSPSTSNLIDWIIAMLQQGWRLAPVIWTRRTPPPAPTLTSPKNGRITLYLRRDGLLDEYLRTPHAHRYIQKLRRKSLGSLQIAAFAAEYVRDNRGTDQELAARLGVARQAVQRARSTAAARVLQLAADDYLAFVAKHAPGVAKKISSALQN
jgi:hypothetical protein